MKHAIVLLLILFAAIVGGCKNKTAKPAETVTSEVVIEQNNIPQQTDTALTEDYCISDTSVGKISMTTPISYIDTLFPDEYRLKEELFNPDGDDSSSFTSYAIYQGDDLIIRIIPEEENIDRIYSIMVFDSRYEISTTGIHVGDDIQKLKMHYHIDDVYFNIADGLYLMSNSFKGAFLIDLEGEGEQYESFDKLDNELKIKAIIVNK